MAAISLPQFGSQPAHAVFTSGECAMALATRKASASFAAPSMRSSTTWETPSPSATIWRASDVQTWFRAAANSGLSSPDPRAAGAGSQQQHSVVGGSVAVDGDAIEADFDGAAQDSYPAPLVRLQHRSGCRPASWHAAQVADESCPSPCTQRQCALPAEYRLAHRSRSENFNSREGGFFHRVGGDDGFGDLLKMVRLRTDDAASAGSAAISFSAGSGTPMTPVEEGKTSSGLQPKVSAAALQVARAASMPAWPAAQLALPALMATTRTLPPVARRCSASMSSGAALTRLPVNAAAADAGASATIRAKSSAAALLQAGLGRSKAKAAGNHKLREIAHRLNSGGIWSSRPLPKQRSQSI